MSQLDGVRANVENKVNEQWQAKNVTCSVCGVQTNYRNAEFIEGDEGIVPDMWVCDRCQNDEERSCELRG